MLDGNGALYEKFEQLKRELEESGMFAQEYKQPIPRYIKTLGVVTAETGAAVRDIIQIAGRRNPYVQILLYPAIVQGEAAVPSIVKGIRTLEAMGVDVMIVGRGGGSIEDLWAFNERAVAEAVFNCSVPVISAVGHETDTTIIDFVADLRAPTPSAAAELAVADIREIFSRMDSYKELLNRLMSADIRRRKEELRHAGIRLKAGSPASRIREKKMFALQAEERLQDRMRKVLDDRRHELALYIERMKGLSPLEKLNSGYSYVADENGSNIRSVAQVSCGQKLVIQVSDGQIGTIVSSVEPVSLDDKEKADGAKEM
jgi:exodeoxyribonuclease VII large subunit